MPNSTPAQISLPLDIPDVDVLATTHTKDGKYIITVESRSTKTECGVCHQAIECHYGHGSKIRLRHLPMLGFETYIDLKPKRGQCGHCKNKPTTTQVLNWYAQRAPHTKAFDQYLMKQLIGSNVSDVSIKEKVTYDAVLGAMKRQVATEVNWDEIDNLGTIGIDEVALKKGRKGYRAVLSARQDDGTTIILAVLDERKKKRSKRF